MLPRQYLIHLMRIKMSVNSTIANM